MNENNLEPDEGMGRRTLLRKAAMGGAVVWATPVVLTLGTGVAAAATRVVLACPDRNSTPPTNLTFEFTGAACSDDDGEALVSSSGTAGFPTSSQLGAGPYRIVATYGPGTNGVTVTFNSVSLGDDLTIGPKPPGNYFGTSTNAKLNPEVTFRVYDLDDNLLRSVTIHTSCSQPLHLDDTFCGFTLLSA